MKDSFGDPWVKVPLAAVSTRAFILGIGMVGLYVWLKHTGQLKRDHHHEGHPH